ncbi:MAG: hypothetical protein K6E55_09670 [Thermoguttaceae bacterium]|nr:hypothetical protein [Thermoguttaceae bacterium]
MTRFSPARAAVFCFALLLGLGLAAGCRDSKSPATGRTGDESADASAAEKPGAETPPISGPALIVFFSRTGEQHGVGVIEKGNTAIMAEMLAEKTGADLFEVVPKDDRYPTDDYRRLTDVGKREQTEKARPEYVGPTPDLSKYKTVFFGSPVWWGDWPMIMYTFFEKNADVLAGKTLVPFATHEGSGLSGFDRKLAAVCPKAAVAKGLAATGTECQKDRESVRVKIDGWLADLGVRESLASAETPGSGAPAASGNTASFVGDDDADDDDDDDGDDD